MKGELSWGQRTVEWVWRWRQILLGAGVLLGALGVVQALPGAGPELVEVPVLRTDLPRGTNLADAQWETILVPEQLRDRWMNADPDMLRTDRIGVAAYPLSAGVPVPSAAVHDPTQPVPDTVQVAVNLSDGAVQQLLSPGMRVDLVGFPDDGPAQVIATGSTVISAQVESDGGMWGGASSGPLLVAVQKEEALVLAEAVLRGPISLLIVD